MNNVYAKARKMGKASFRKAVIAGKYPYVKALEKKVDMQDLFPIRLGVLQIPTVMIAGTLTESRGNAFSRDFYPLMGEDTEFAFKWSSLFQAQIEEGISDPIVVYEYKRKFYVKEGNKRVSVFRYLDNPTMAADVTRLVSKEKDALDEEFETFFRNVPLYEMDFSTVGSYRRLTRYFNQKWDEPWSREDIDRLRSSFYTFVREYGEEQEENEVADQFLAYLSLYGPDLRVVGKSELAKRCKLMKKEMVAKKDGEITLSEKPQEQVQNVLSRISQMRKHTVAFIYESNPKDEPFTFEHEAGRLFIENKYSPRIHTVKYENCATQEEVRKALEEASMDADLIFTTSPMMLSETKRAAMMHTNIHFLNASLYQNSGAVSCYDIKTYEAKFLLGALAASLSKEHSLAYLADYPIYGTMADINAFAIGAALIDPQANVYLGWTKTLDANYKQQMEELDIHLYCGADSADASGSLEYGLYRLENGEITNIAAPVINYATYYTKLVELLLQGQLNVHKEKALNYWWGMDAGVLDINMSSRIPYSSRKLVHLFKQGLVSGTLNPFEGELHAQEKVIQGAYGARLSSQEIASMMWLNDNVIGTLPHYNSYDEKTRELLEDQGAFLKEGE